MFSVIVMKELRYDYLALWIGLSTGTMMGNSLALWILSRSGPKPYFFQRQLLLHDLRYGCFLSAIFLYFMLFFS